jgi:hypothetical protein
MRWSRIFRPTWKVFLAFAPFVVSLTVWMQCERTDLIAGEIQQGQHAPMDLIWQAGAEDLNGLPQNPRWFWQVTHNNPSESLPDPSTLCSGFPYLVPNDPSHGVSYGDPPCVSQKVSLDYPTGFQDFICSNFGGEAGKLHGHVDWIPARYDGLLFWKGFTPWYKLGDGDYNFWLVPPNDGGLTASNKEALSMEFDSHETINHFTSPWWKSFHQAVDQGTAEPMVRRKYAIAIGLLGIDTEHENHSELHPVYLMAVHVKSDPNDDVWAIFARNWGNEGYCSQNQHLLNFEGNQLKVILPANSGASNPELLSATTFQASSPDLKWSWSYVPRGILFTASLGAPDAHSRLNGELHLRWKTAAAGGTNERGFALSQEDFSTLASVESITGPAQPESVESEKNLSDMFRKLTPEKQAELESHLKGLAPSPTADGSVPAKISLNRPRNSGNLNLMLIQPPVNKPTERSVKDPEKLARDRQQALAICDAKNADPAFAPEITPELCQRLQRPLQ